MPGSFCAGAKTIPDTRASLHTYEQRFQRIKSRLDCKIVDFFSRSVKKSGKRGVRVLRACSVSPQSRSLISASFQTFCLTARAYLNTQKYGLFCSLNFGRNFCKEFLSAPRRSLNRLESHK